MSVALVLAGNIVKTQDRALPCIFICFFVLANKGSVQPMFFLSFWAGLFKEHSSFWYSNFSVIS